MGPVVIEGKRKVFEVYTLTLRDRKRQDSGSIGEELTMGLSIMKREFNWLVFDRGIIIAGFVSHDDAAAFVEQCGSDSMEIFAAGVSSADVATGAAPTNANVRDSKATTKRSQLNRRQVPRSQSRAA